MWRQRSSRAAQPGAQGRGAVDSEVVRPHLLLLLALTGCKYLDQPKKVAELEKRLDEVSGALSDLTGEPVGQRPGKASADDERAAKGN